MRKLFAALLAAILLLSLACAWAETATDAPDLTGSTWTMDYFDIPMLFVFNEDGTFVGTIDMDIPVADDGSNSFAGTWEFDGETLMMYGDDGDVSFTWDGEKMTGIMFDTEVYLLQALKTEEPAA